MIEKKKISNHGVKFMQGNEACAIAAIHAGCSFFGGYPITPATEVAEIIAEELPKHGGTFIQMEDEIASITSLAGARWGGAKSMTSTSGPGFSLMQEGIGFAYTTETPMVVVNVMRGGPSTGQPTMSAQQEIMQSKWGSHGDYEMIVLMPSSVQEMYDFTIKAFNLSEKYRMPVVMLTDEVIGHMREKIVIPEEVEIYKPVSPEKIDGLYSRNEDLTPQPVEFYQGHNILVEGQLHNKYGVRISTDPVQSAELIYNLINKVQNNIEDIVDVQGENTDAETIIVGLGSVARPALKAMKLANAEGLNVGFCKINTPWPMPEKQLLEMFPNAKNIVVPEMNVGRYVHELGKVFKDAKAQSLPLIGGELHTPDMILAKVKEVM